MTVNAQGQTQVGQVQRMTPIYEMFKVPGQQGQSFNLVDAFVPVSQGDQIQTMSGFIVAGSDPGHYGQLTVFQTPPIDGPALVDADIAASQNISQKISLLNQQGSSVLLGTLQLVPVGNAMLYFRPFYVQSARNPFPNLEFYIVVYSGPQNQSKVSFDSTLSAALNDLFSVSLPTPGSSPTSPTPPLSGTVSQRVLTLITQANTEQQQAQTDLKAGNFAAYGTDESQLQNTLQQLKQAAGTGTGSSTASSTTTTPGTSSSSTSSSTSPKKSSKTSASASSTSTPKGAALLQSTRHRS